MTKFLFVHGGAELFKSGGWWHMMHNLHNFWYITEMSDIDCMPAFCQLPHPLVCFNPDGGFASQVGHVHTCVRAFKSLHKSAIPAIPISSSSLYPALRLTSFLTSLLTLRTAVTRLDISRKLAISNGMQTLWLVLTLTHTLAVLNSSATGHNRTPTRMSCHESPSH